VLRGFKAQCFGVSVDTAGTNRQFAQSLGLDYPILGDSDKRVARSYGVLSATGFPHRWTFYVDKNVRPNSHGSDIAKRLAVLGVSRDETESSRRTDK